MSRGLTPAWVYRAEYDCAGKQPARTMIDPPSPSWLGLRSGRDRVRRSGLWNQRHVDESYEPRFLDMLEKAIEHGADS